MSRRVSLLLLLLASLPLAAQIPAPKRTVNPHGNIKIACENCHTSVGWRPIRPQPEFDHNVQTNYPLRGSHEGVACKSCHVDRVFKNTPHDCASCHADIHRRQNGAQCQECHTIKGWRVAVRETREHNNRFPLMGAHVTAPCESCHRSAGTGIYAGLSTQCAACHTADYARSQNPPHTASKFPLQCEQCHSMDGWIGGKFNHAAMTSFALTGAHQQATCVSCHVGGRYAGTPTQCFDCHAKQYTVSINPNHAQAGFPHDCATCHTTTQWAGAKFDHAGVTGFALTGAHQQVACSACHVGGRFAGTATTCEGCHLGDFNKTTNPNHVQSHFAADCTQCHTTIQWKGAKFDHNLSRFPLTGTHTNVACASCHVQGRFTGTPMTCDGCHLPDFNKTVNPNHVSAGFPKDCATCHNTAQWKGAAFDHNSQTKFTLTGAHINVQCAQCHVGGKFAGTAATCDGCHLPDYNKTTNPNHIAAGFPKDCAACHNTTQWKGARFDHNSQTKFALTGAHVNVQCAQCHVGGRFAGTASTCDGCHLPDYNKTTNPNHASAGFPKDCATCHNTSQWSGAKFDHNTLTKFQLTGAHVNVQCAQCHVGGKFAGTPATCDGCHLSDYNKAANPNHLAAGFPKDCAACHNTSQWKGAVFNHNSQTRFQLTGAHITAQCSQCHVNGVFKGTPATCDGCHLPDYSKTTNPNHAAANFPTNCAVCHNTSQWKGAQFDHAKTQFPLTGAHITVQCAQCHVGGKYSGTPNSCDGCHLADYNKTVNPNHISAGFPKDCAVCHNTTQWKGAKFDHNTLTKFPLTGAHVTAQCSQCHINGVFKGTPATCDGCHLADYNKTTSPNHTAAGFPKDCAVCHNTTQWKGAKFDHNTLTKFPLTGAHITAQCSQCHINGVYKGTPATCDGCHLADYNKSTNPNHAAAGFPKDCATCHNTTQWKGAKFDHNTLTKFPLSGAHITAQCSQCHVNGVFKGTPATCEGCHISDYNKTVNPNHIAAGFPKDCAICHTTTQWKGAKFDHSSLTKFPLTGAHNTVPCAQCHVNGVFKGTPTACEGCHLADYNKTTNPNHAAAGFPTTCATCHNTTQWKGATFNHSLTKFPLTGAHTTVQCSQCHVNGVFKGTPTTCDGCHLPDYNKTTNPNHVAAGFPKDCSVCHNTTQWKGATFNHNTLTKFPLTGAHTSIQCSQCHVNNVFKGTPSTCDGCHLTLYNKTTNPNHVAAGFPKDCSVCHNTTQWKGAVFNHSLTKFPLTGTHATTACALCHKSNVYAGTPTNCDACHLTEYNGTTNPNHIAAGFPKDCSICHNTAQWKGAVFDHSKTKFPLTGAHTTVQCALCHVGGRYAGTPTDCYSCHRTQYESVSNPNHRTAGFPQDCTMCHTTTTWSGAKFAHSFPIYSGAHNGKWTTCADCHTNSANYTIFSCINCHTHNQTDTDRHHGGVRGYVYASPSCYQCHPNGRAG
jgi:hypothetical protein